MKGKALIRPVLNLRTANLCIVMDGARISSVTAWEIMKEEERRPRPGFSWQRGVGGTPGLRASAQSSCHGPCFGAGPCAVLQPPSEL